MKNEVAELREKLQTTSQKAKEKLQQETPAGSGSGEPQVSVRGLLEQDPAATEEAANFGGKREV